jgi:MFS family permease
MQDGLRLGDAGRQWVVNGYTIAYAGLLLLGGRLADVAGRRRAYLAGMGLFVAGSLAGGLAAWAGMLVAGRVTQGIGAALLSATTLAVLLSAFAEGPRRAAAIGWWMATGAAGDAAGGLVGGALTAWLSWRWVLLVNAPVGVAVLIAAARLLRDDGRARRARLDLPGAMTATAGLVALVLAITEVQAHGWTAAQVLVPLAAALVLLGAFVALERRAAHDALVPAAVVRLPGLAVANAVTLVSTTGLFAVWFLLTLHLQDVLGLGPLQAGLGFVPLTLAVVAGTQLTTRLRAGRDARVTISAALALSAAGLAGLAAGVDGGGYVAGVALPGALAMLGAGMAFPPLAGAATAGAGAGAGLHGLVSGIVNTSRMVGAALGVAVLATVAASGSAPAAGLRAAYLVAAGAVLLAAARAWLRPAPRRSLVRRRAAPAGATVRG